MFISEALLCMTKKIWTFPDARADACESILHEIQRRVSDLISYLIHCVGALHRMLLKITLSVKNRKYLPASPETVISIVWLETLKYSWSFMNAMEHLQNGSS